MRGLSSGVTCFASALLSGEFRQHSFEKENQGILHLDFSPVFLFWSVVVLVFVHKSVYILIQKRVIAFWVFSCLPVCLQEAEQYSLVAFVLIRWRIAEFCIYVKIYVTTLVDTHCYLLVFCVFKCVDWRRESSLFVWHVRLLPSGIEEVCSYSQQYRPMRKTRPSCFFVRSGLDVVCATVFLHTLEYVHMQCPPPFGQLHADFWGREISCCLWGSLMLPAGSESISDSQWLLVMAF